MRKYGIYVSSLEQKGGGERYAFCLRDAFLKEGHDVKIICDYFQPISTFGGAYDTENLIVLNPKTTNGKTFFSKFFKKTFLIKKLRRTLQQENIDMVICQSEFDSIRVMIATLMTKISYLVYVFGQTYQFESDLTKYATIFNKNHLEILDSRPGYRDIHKEKFPSKNPLLRIVVEVVALFKYFGLIKARYLLTLSRQVAWETEKMVGRRSIPLPAAIWKSEINLEKIIKNKQKNLKQNYKILSISRLVKKKRVNIIIEAISELTDGYILDVVGEGPERKNLENLVKIKGLQNRVSFKGGLSDKECKKLLDKADMFISMDRADYDITVFEALANGVPSIVSEDYDLDFEGGAECGIIQAEANPIEIANSIRESKRHLPNKQATISTLERLTWENVVNQIDRLSKDENVIIQADHKEV